MEPRIMQTVREKIIMAQKQLPARLDKHCPKASVSVSKVHISLMTNVSQTMKDVRMQLTKIRRLWDVPVVASGTGKRTI
jgi:hypothetical protein